MVKLSSFQAACFDSSTCQTRLSSDMEILGKTPMSFYFDAENQLKQGTLQQQPRPTIYLYGQRFKGCLSYGVMGLLSIQDYLEGRIKLHEKTLSHCQDLINVIHEKHICPIVLSYYHQQHLGGIIQSIISMQKPICSWRTEDLREHWVWRVDAEADTILSEVAKIPELYLLDGHHRLKAAGQSYLNNEKKSKFSKIQGILYSKKYVNTFSQHRGLSNLPEDLNLIEHMTNNLGIEVRKLKEDGSKQKLETALAYKGNLYEVIYNADQPQADEAETSAGKLEQKILKPLNSNRKLKVTYVPGINQAKTENYDAVFYVQPPSTQDLFKISDLRKVLPAKSTWIEPKICSHMVIRIF